MYLLELSLIVFSRGLMSALGALGLHRQREAGRERATLYCSVVVVIIHLPLVLWLVVSLLGTITIRMGR